MLSPIDTRILTARPDHLRPLTAAERTAQRLRSHRRHARLQRLVRALHAWLQRRLNAPA